MEVRKTRPDTNTVFVDFIYCTSRFRFAQPFVPCRCLGDPDCFFGGFRSRYFGDGADALNASVIVLFGTRAFADIAARPLSVPFRGARSE